MIAERDVERHMAKAIAWSGMAVREAQSTIDGITPEILRMLPEGSVGGAAAGSLGYGFGLSGPVGCGKTGAVAALAVTFLRARITDGKYSTAGEFTMDRGTVYSPPPVAWSSWPEMVNQFRAWSSMTSGVRRVEREVDRLTRVPMLVLDDMGAERVRGDYAEDWATTQLDLIIDGRYRNDMGTWYTTSMPPGALLERYGRRVIDRLWGTNPILTVPAMRSRRRDTLA